MDTNQDKEQKHELDLEPQSQHRAPEAARKKSRLLLIVILLAAGLVALLAIGWAMLIRNADVADKRQGTGDVVSPANTQQKQSSSSQKVSGDGYSFMMPASYERQEKTTGGRIKEQYMLKSETPFMTVAVVVQNAPMGSPKPAQDTALELTNRFLTKPNFVKIADTAKTVSGSKEGYISEIKFDEDTSRYIVGSALLKDGVHVVSLQIAYPESTNDSNRAVADQILNSLKVE